MLVSNQASGADRAAHAFNVLESSGQGLADSGCVHACLSVGLAYAGYSCKPAIYVQKKRSCF
jgi:hypothetical protein